MAKKTADLGNEAKYVKLTLYPKRRMFNFFVTVILTLLFSTWVWINLTQKRADHWFLVGLPMVFLGLLTNFLMPVEEWSYGPWQDASQKYEKNIYD